MVKVPIPPADQWVSAVQKSKSEKKAAEAVGAQLMIQFLKTRNSD